MRLTHFLFIFSLTNTNSFSVCGKTLHTIELKLRLVYAHVIYLFLNRGMSYLELPLISQTF